MNEEKGFLYVDEDKEIVFVNYEGDKAVYLYTPHKTLLAYAINIFKKDKKGICVYFQGNMKRHEKIKLHVSEDVYMIFERVFIKRIEDLYEDGDKEEDPKDIIRSIWVD
jgi:hypothetical protein